MTRFITVLISSWVLLFTTTIAQNVNIPDENFKNGLINLGVDTNNDGEISFEEASDFSGQLLLDSLGIENLIGIEAFTSIKCLSVNHNQLDSLNYTLNPQLESLYCADNNIGFLDVTGYPNIVNLDCSLNDLNNLLLLNLANLISLNCSSNILTALDPSGCSSLKYLICNDNQLDSLDLSSCSVTSLNCNRNKLISILFSPNGIQRIHCAHNQLFELNANNQYILFLDCGFNKIKKLDLSNQPFLEYLYCNNNNMDTLHLLQTKWSYYKKLDCSFNNLKNSSTKFIYNFDLNFIDCSHNQFDSIYFYNENYSVFDSLTELNCASNNLYGELNLDNFPFLKNLDCSNNFIENIEFENCKILDTLICGNNLMEELDISQLVQLKVLDISYSSSFIEICTDKLPYDFDIIHAGPTYYNLSVCNPNDPQLFLAGQFRGCYHIYMDYSAPYNNGYIDCNNDGINDILFLRNFQSESYKYKIFPLLDNQISSLINSQGNTIIKGFYYNDTVYPVNYNYYDSVLIPIYGEIEDDDWYWTTHMVIGGDKIFSALLPSENDTSYAWLKIDHHFVSYGWMPSRYHISEVATWKPCYLSHSIGSDTTINVGDTLTIDAGDGHDGYYWNTKDTTQMYQFISNKWGGGTWEIISYIENDHCYSSDTLYVTVIGESIISDYEWDQLNIYPNPVRNKLTLTNPSNQNFTFEIYNLSSEKIYHRKFYGKADNIDVSSLAPGIYICKITSEVKSKTIKIIKY